MTYRSIRKKQRRLPRFSVGLSLFFFLFAGQLCAQGGLTVFSSAGGVEKVQLNGMELDCFWNIGEPITEEFGSRPGFDASKKRLTQGFEQGEGFIADELHTEIYTGENYSVELFPNPVRGVLRVRLVDSRDLKYGLSVRNFQGVCLKQMAGLRAGTHTVDMSEMKDGIYLLEIEATGYVRVFKIIKVS